MLRLVNSGLNVSRGGREFMKIVTFLEWEGMYDQKILLLTLFLSSLDNFLEEPCKHTHFRGCTAIPSCLFDVMHRWRFSVIHFTGPRNHWHHPSYLCILLPHLFSPHNWGQPPTLLQSPASPEGSLKDILWNEALLLLLSCWAHVVLSSSRSLQPKASQERAKGISREQVLYSRSPVRFLERKGPWQEAWHIGTAKN